MVDNYRTHGTGTAQQRNCHRYNGDRLFINRLYPLLRRISGTVMRSFDHGNPHEQNDNTARNLKRGNTDAEKFQPKIASCVGNQRRSVN